MPKMVGFHHGALCDSYEKQANEQGLTLGKDKELLEKLGFCVVMCHIHGLLTESRYDEALKRLQKKIVKSLKPLKQEK